MFYREAIDKAYSFTYSLLYPVKKLGPPWARNTSQDSLICMVTQLSYIHKPERVSHDFSVLHHIKCRDRSRVGSQEVWTPSMKPGCL